MPLPNLPDGLTLKELLELRNQFFASGDIKDMNAWRRACNTRVQRLQKQLSTSAPLSGYALPIQFKKVAQEVTDALAIISDVDTKTADSLQQLRGIFTINSPNYGDNAALNNSLKQVQRLLQDPNNKIVATSLGFDNQRPGHGHHEFMRPFKQTAKAKQTTNPAAQLSKIQELHDVFTSKMEKFLDLKQENSDLTQAIDRKLKTGYEVVQKVGAQDRLDLGFNLSLVIPSTIGDDILIQDTTNNTTAITIKFIRDKPPNEQNFKEVIAEITPTNPFNEAVMYQRQEVAVDVMAKAARAAGIYWIKVASPNTMVAIELAAAAIIGQSIPVISKDMESILLLDKVAFKTTMQTRYSTISALALEELWQKTQLIKNTLDLVRTSVQAPDGSPGKIPDDVIDWDTKNVVKKLLIAYHTEVLQRGNNSKRFTSEEQDIIASNIQQMHSNTDNIGARPATPPRLHITYNRVRGLPRKLNT